MPSLKALNEQIDALAREYGYHAARGARFADRECLPQLAKLKAERREIIRLITILQTLLFGRWYAEYLVLCEEAERMFPGDFFA